MWDKRKGMERVKEGKREDEVVSWDKDARIRDKRGVKTREWSTAVGTVLG